MQASPRSTMLIRSGVVAVAIVAVGLLGGCHTRRIVSKQTRVAVVGPLAQQRKMETSMNDADNFFPIGFWWPPPPRETTDERYKEIAECNFTLVLGGNGNGSCPTNIKRLNACQKSGLKFLALDSRLYGKKATETPEWEKTIEEVVNAYKDHPALWGYMLMDEPNASMFPHLAYLVKKIKEKDPNHISSINLLPTYANPVQMGAVRVDEDVVVKQLGFKTYEGYIDSFMSTVKPEILCYDHYPLLADGSDRSDFYENMEIIRRAALKYDVPFWGFALTIPHNSAYRNPTEAELYWQIYSLLAYGAKGILYFTYWTPKGTNWQPPYAIIDPEGIRTEHYGQVKRLNAEVKSLGPVLLGLSSEGVYHVGDTPQGCSRFKSNDLFESITGSPLVVGIFRDKTKNKYAILVNKDYKKSRKARVTLASKQKAEIFNCSSGKWESVKLSNFDLTLEPGRGKMLKIRSSIGGSMCVLE